ncbi:MAG: NAD(P)/FAD-dependent oxidoreductase [Oscillospiraceae bacterium]|nr:NAD(P)/FAD-dependent oxidoreductase [Oscillospiraceae bacterium]
MTNYMKTDIVIIGAGPAGLAAALAAHETGAEVLILERDDRTGGILNQCVHNGFGLHYFGEELTGPEYAKRFADKVLYNGIEVLTGAMVLSVKRYAETGVLNVTASSSSGLMKIEARSVILATGCRERTRGAIGIPGARPAGVYTAGAAQRLVNINGYLPGREVVILGSGDIGLIMARRMTWEGAHVSLVLELMPYSSGLTRNIVQCVRDNDIPLLFNTTVVQVHGGRRVTGVTVAQVDENRRPIMDTARLIPCDTLLLSVGLIPENELARAAGVAIDPVTGGAIVDGNCETSVPGIFACGNALHVHDLVDFVSREAERAGRAAALLNEESIMKNEELPGSPTNPQIWRGGLTVVPKGQVSYTVPQKIAPQQGRDVDVFFRVKSVVKPASLTISSGGTVLYKSRKQIMTPGEMEHVTLKADKLAGITGDINVSAEVGDTK